MTSVASENESGKGWAYGCVGCGLLPGLMAFYMYATMLVAWPLGDILQIGEWEESNSDEGGWTFFFDIDYANVEWVCFLGLLLLLVLAIALSIYTTSRHAIRNPHFADLPHPEETPSEILAELQKAPDKILLHFLSQREAGWGGRLTRMAPSFCLLPVFLGAGALLARTLGDRTLGEGPTPARISLVILCALPSAVLLLQCLWAALVSARVDDRLLVDFVAGEVRQVDVGNPKDTHAQPLFGFSVIGHLDLKKTVKANRSLVHYKLSIVPTSERDPIALFTSFSEDNCEAVGTLLAQRFNTTLKHTRVDLPPEN